MSHVTDLKVEVKDIKCLQKAAESLGMELVEKSTYKWFGRHVGDYPIPAGFTKEDMGKCNYALRIKGKPDAYEVGVCKRKDGKPGFTLMWDFWQGGYGLQGAIGKGGEKLKQAYSVEVARKQMQPLTRDGWRLEQQKLPDGRVVLKARR